MNATDARHASVKKRANDQATIPALIYSRIQDRSSNGKKYLLCRSNKQTRQQLKSDGFGVIFLLTITLIRW